MNPERTSLIGRIIRKPITILMLFLSLIGTGMIAYMKIPVNFMPSGFEFNTISISIPSPDSSPLENEDKITKPVEEIIRSIPGITEIRSYSGSFGCEIRVEFGSKTDIDMAYMEVKDRIERVKHNFPDKVERYTCARFNMDTDMPIFAMAVVYEESVDNPLSLTENIIIRRLESVDGVALVDVQGLVDEVVRIFLDPAKVQGHKINLYDLVTRMATDNFTRPAGRIMDGERRYDLRLDSQYDDLVEVEEFPVRDGLKVKDIGEVVLGRSYRDYVARVNGKPGLFFNISKESQKNTVAVCEAIEAEIERLRTDPRLDGFEFLEYFNQREIIESSLSTLKTSMAWGGLFALIVLFLFLRHVRATLIVALAIPTSILIALVVVFFAGKSINVLSLAGFTLAVGMLVDNAIVVTENIFRRKSAGLSPAEASARGAGEVGTAILMATCTTIIVFLPLIFFQESKLLKLVLAEIGLPISFSLIASLFSALAFIPLATTYLIWRRNSGSGGKMPAFLRSYHRRGGLTAIYEKAVGWVMRHRFGAILIALACLATTGIASGLVDQVLEESMGGDGIRISIDLPNHYNLDEANEVFKKLEAFMQSHLEEFGFEAFICFFNRNRGMMMGFFGEEADIRLRRDTPKKIMEILPPMPGVTYDLRIEGADTTRKDFRVEITGPNSRMLADIAFDLKKRFQQIPEITNVRTDIERGRDEVRVEVDRELAAKFGVDPEVLRGTVAWGLGGQRLPDFVYDGIEYPMQIEYEEALVESLEMILNMEITTNQGTRLPLASLVDLRVTKGPAMIFRQDGRTSLGISATPVTDNIFTVSRKVADIMRDYDFPRGYTWQERGGREEYGEALQDFIMAFAMSLILVFILMGILFESFILPITVLVSVPFAIMGGMWLLVISDTPLGIYGFAGFILLAGIVVNNAIVLIDHINRLRREGLSLTDAVIRGGCERLRPILMTALTTISGLWPMAMPELFATDASSVFSYRSLAIVVLGGLIFATFFTVFVIPLAYSLLDDMGKSGSRILTGAMRLGRRRTAPPPAGDELA